MHAVAMCLISSQRCWPVLPTPGWDRRYKARSDPPPEPPAEPIRNDRRNATRTGCPRRAADRERGPRSRADPFLRFRKPTFRSAARDRQAPSQRCRGRAAFWVPPATHADSLLLASLRSDVVHDVIRAARISTHSCGYVVQTQVIPCSPRDVVIRAGAVATHADGADQDVGAVV